MNKFELIIETLHLSKEKIIDKYKNTSCTLNHYKLVQELIQEPLNTINNWKEENLELTEKDKFNFITRYLNIKGGDIAEKLNIDNSTVSRWKKNTNAVVFDKNKYSLFTENFDIPIEIFNKDINTIRKIEIILKQVQENLLSKDFKKDILQKLQGKWYWYGYTTNRPNKKNFWENNISIDLYTVTNYISYEISRHFVDI